MTKEQIVGLAVRLFAVFLALYALRHSIGLLTFVSTPSLDNFSIAIYSVMALLPLLAAVLLWFFPLTVAGNLIPKLKPDKKIAKLDAGSIEVVAFTVMGLWVLASAIPDVFYWITYVYRVKTMGIGSPGIPAENIAHMVSTAVELAIGLLLLFGSKGLINIIRRARQAGR